MKATTQKIASDFGAVTTIHRDPTSNAHILVADQFGSLKRVNVDSGEHEETLLDFSETLADLGPFSKDAARGLNPGYDERGLLGFVPAPGYGVSNRRLYVYYSKKTEDEKHNHISQVSAFDLDRASETELLSIPEPDGTHNGGCLDLDSQGRLYIAIGDGGCCGDQHGEIGNGQNTQNLLGTVCRIDPTAVYAGSASQGIVPCDNPFYDDDEVRSEIFAYGLRNPWRIHVDHYDRVFAANVGEGEDEQGEGWESIYLLHGGENCGWRIEQGSRAFDLELAKRLGIERDELHKPIFEYSHKDNGRAVIGGFVYQGMEMPNLRNAYVFGDWSSSWGVATANLSYLVQERSNEWNRYRLGPKSLDYFLTTIGEGLHGEIYLGVKEGVKMKKPAHVLKVETV